MDFRSDPDFHRMGFGRRDNEYGRWLTRVEALDELTVLMDIDLGPSRLIYLAQDYMLNEGKSASGASKQAELLFGNLTGISPGTEALNSSELVEREIQWYVIHPCYQLAAQNLGLSLEDATRIFKSELDFVASDADSGGTRAIRSGNHLRICRERMQRIHAGGIAREHG